MLYVTYVANIDFLQIHKISLSDFIPSKEIVISTFNYEINKEACIVSWVIILLRTTMSAPPVLSISQTSSREIA